MIDRVLIDTLNFKSDLFARRWAKAIRKAQQLKHYNRLSDETLEHLGRETYPQLARFIENGLDRSVLGEYFVRMGKTSVKHGFPLSETVFGLRLSQQTIFEYIANEFVTDNTVALYQTIAILPKIADFFVLGCFYLNKGFQEATFASMNTADNVSEELLRKYFRDDFFFKKD